jgi:hypothetical protein
MSSGEDHEAELDLAQSVLIKFGYIDACEVHRQFSDATKDPPPDRADRATIAPMVSAMRAGGWRGNEAEARALWRRAMTELSASCDGCDEDE